MTRNRQSFGVYDGVYIYIYNIKLARRYTTLFYLGVARRSASLGVLGVAWRLASLDSDARGRSLLGVARRARRCSASLGAARRRSALLGVQDFPTILPMHSTF